MTPYKSKKSFKTRLVIAISIVNLAVILAITYLTYRWNAQQLQEQTIAQTQQTIEQAGTNVSTYMDELYRLTLTPYYNDEVLSQLEYSPNGFPRQTKFQAHRRRISFLGYDSSAK